MNDGMKLHTRHLAIRVAFIIGLFAILAMSRAAMQRYRESLEKMLVSHRAIKQNLGKMRISTLELRNSIANFKRMLPAGHENKSAEGLAYSRLDEVKTHLPYGELQVKPLETKDDLLAIEFSFKQTGPSCNGLLNTLGQLETAVLPFVFSREIAIEAATPENKNKMTFTLSGVILTQGKEPATAAPAPPTPAPPATKGGRP